MKCILVATDLTGRSDRAMDRAAILAKAMNVPLQIVYVVDDQVTTTIARACEENATAELERQVSESKLFAGVETSIDVAFGEPWRQITKLARKSDAGLVVLGAHRNRGIRELFAGTTLHRVAKASPVPLLVAIDRASGSYRNVIVGVDFSECARNATAIARRIAPGHPLTLVHAYHIPFKALTMRTDTDGEIAGHEKTRIETEIRRQMDSFLDATAIDRIGLDIVIAEGGAVSILQAEAVGRKADLVCVGSHGKPWLVEAVLGSTAQELLSFPPCDILVAPLR